MTPTGMTKPARVQKAAKLRKKVSLAFSAVFVVLSVPATAFYVHIELAMNRGAYYCNNPADLARELTCPLDLLKVMNLLGEALIVSLMLFGIPLGSMLLVVFVLDLTFDGVGGGRVLWTPRLQPSGDSDVSGTDTD